MSDDKKDDGQSQDYTNLPSSIGPYEIKQKTNDGGYSKIYMGISKYTNDKVSIKIIDKSTFIKNPDDLLLVKNEIDILKILKHRNILTLYEIYESNQYVFLVTEHLSSELLNLILNKKRLNEQDAGRIFVQLVDALQYAHKMQICHRDIRVEHVMFDNNNIPKLIDFGYSSFYRKGQTLQEPIGSLSYACPEIIQQRSYDPELADVWSLGVCLYVMLCGYLPFSEEDDEQNNKLICSGKIDYPNEIGNICKDLLKKMIEVNPKKRLNFLKVSRHPWVKQCKEVKIIGGFNTYEMVYPVDERVLKIINEYGIDPKKVEAELKSNKYTSNTGLFKLLLKKLLELKFGTISDFTTHAFVEYMEDKKNVIQDGQKKYSDFLNKTEEKSSKIQKTIFEYKKKEDNVVNKLEELKLTKDDIDNKAKVDNNKKEDQTKNIKVMKDDNELGKNKSNIQALASNKKEKDEKKQNKVIQQFVEEYKKEHPEFGGTNTMNIENTKRKNSPKLHKRKLNLDLLYEEPQSQKGELKLDKNRKRVFNMVAGRKSQFITMFRKPPARLRRTSISTSQLQLLMRKPPKKVEEEKKMNEIVEEEKDEDSKSEKSDESKSEKSEKSKNSEKTEKERDKYSFSFDDEEGEEKSDNESEKKEEESKEEEEKKEKEEESKEEEKKEEKEQEEKKDEVKEKEEEKKDKLEEKKDVKEEIKEEKNEIKNENDKKEEIKQEFKVFAFDNIKEMSVKNIEYYHDDNIQCYISPIDTMRELMLPKPQNSLPQKNDIQKEEKIEESPKKENGENIIEEQENKENLNEEKEKEEINNQKNKESDEKIIKEKENIIEEKDQIINQKNEEIKENMMEKKENRESIVEEKEKEKIINQKNEEKPLINKEEENKKENIERIIEEKTIKNKEEENKKEKDDNINLKIIKKETPLINEKKNKIKKEEKIPLLFGDMKNGINKKEITLINKNEKGKEEKMPIIFENKKNKIVKEKKSKKENEKKEDIDIVKSKDVSKGKNNIEKKLYEKIYEDTPGKTNNKKQNEEKENIKINSNKKNLDKNSYKNKKQTKIISSIFQFQNKNLETINDDEYNDKIKSNNNKEKKPKKIEEPEKKNVLRSNHSPKKNKRNESMEKIEEFSDEEKPILIQKRSVLDKALRMKEKERKNKKNGKKEENENNQLNKNKHIDLEDKIDDLLYNLANKPKKTKKFQTITQYKEKAENKGKEENDSNNIGVYEEIIFRNKVPFLFQNNTFNNNNQISNNSKNNTSNNNKIRNNSKNNPINLKAKINPENAKKQINKNNLTRNKDNKNKKNNTMNTELIFSISHENDIRLSGSPINEIKKVSNNPLINKIANINSYEKEDINNEKKEEENNESNENDYEEQNFKSTYNEKYNNNDLIKLSINKNGDSKKKNENENLRYINSGIDINNNINYDEQITKYNELLFYRQEEKFLERQKKLEIQKNKLKKELNKMVNKKYYLNNLDMENKLNNQTNNDDCSKNMSTISSIECNIKPKIKVINKIKNKGKYNSMEKLMHTKDEMILNKDEPCSNQDDFANLKYRNLQNIQVQSPRSIATKAKEEPLKFISDYYIKKDKINNGFNNINENQKNVSVFDIIKDIKNSNNNVLENKLSKFKGNNKNSVSRNKKKNKNVNKSDSIKILSQNIDNREYKNIPTYYYSPSIKSKTKKRIRNNPSNLNKISNHHSINKISPTKHNFSSFNRSPCKKLIRLNEMLAGKIKSPTKNYTNSKNKIYSKNKIKKNKSKRYNSAMNINEVEHNNFDDNFNKFNKTAQNTNSNNYIYTSNDSSKRRRRICKNPLSFSTERNYYNKK